MRDTMRGRGQASAKYLRDYFWASLRGVWTGFERTDTIVIVLIVIIFLVSWYTATEFRGELPEWLIAAFAFVLVVYEVQRAEYQL
jgi:hypothetical protein